MKWIDALSIKRKIILAFSSIFLLVNIMLLLLSYTLTDDFFIAMNFRNMDNQASEKIDTLSQSDNDIHVLEALADEIQKFTGGDTYLINSDLSYRPMPKSREEQLTYALTNYHYLFDQAIASGQVEMALIGDGNYMNRKIVYIKQVPSGELIVVIKSMGLIMEAQALFMKFLLISSIYVYCVSIILVILFAERFTKPIKEVEQTALKISQLNFENTLDENRLDEIGSLNKHINLMSKELSSTIVELHESNRKLETELNKEKNMEAMRERFVSDVSHELKNPISMIMGYAEGINRGLAKTEEDKAFYNNVILEEGSRMNRLVEELLDLSSYRTGSITLEKEHFFLEPLLSKSIEKYKLIQTEKQLKVNLEVIDSVSINADSLRFSQVINNLLDNAFKYTHKNGRIQVVLEKETLTISNTGRLIPLEEFGNIWNSFYQLDTEHEGSGIGLAIVKSIVELHNFSIEGYSDGDINHFKISFKKQNAQ